jgi:hypothetical protein
VLGRERHEREQVFLSLLEQLADLRRDRLQAGQNVGQPAAGLSAVGGVEDLPERGGHQATLGGTAVAVHVSDEVHTAALPRRVEDPRDRRLQALVMIADDQPQALQAAGPEAAQKLRPERLGLDLAEVQADHLAATGVMHGGGDDEGLGDHAAAVADLQMLGVQPQIRIRALKRPRPKLLDMLVELAA